MRNTANRSGFTIVELLIVIVVIAILATISTVAYAGIQNRAYVTAAGAARSAYIRALKLYKVDKGRYPVVPADGQTVCLGELAHYPAKDGFASGQCRYSDYGAATATVDAAVTSELKTYITTAPSVNWPPATEYYVGTGTDYYRGIFYYAGTTANQGKDASIWFYIKGSQTCPQDGYGGYNSDTGETQCTVYLQ